jgi:O-succinylbenzoate synthase
VKYRFEFRRYALPFRAPVRTAHGVWPTREGVIVRLENEGGAVVYGEAAPIPWFGTETVDEITQACRELSADVDDERLDALPARLGCLRGALAAARMFILREETKTKPWPAPLPVAALLPAGRPALEKIARLADAGFRTFKWKVGVGEVTDELALLDDLVAKFPAGARLRLDANGAWDRRRAERWLERAADRPIEFIEQPIAAEVRGAKDLLIGLAADYPTPLALDESVVHVRDLDHWLGAGWPGVFVVKPALLGDVAGAYAQLRTAKARVVFSSALETAVGAQAALRLAFSWGGEPRALGFGVWPLFADARFDGPFAAPFLHAEEVERLNPEAVWNALR